jgi:tetratricopeptide (TPR) repeat protein
LADSIEAAALRQRDQLSEFDRVALDRVVAFRAGRWEDVYAAAKQLVAIAPETQDAQVYLVHAAMATRRFSEVIAMAHRVDRTRGWLKDMPMIHDFDLQAHRLRGEYETAVAEWGREWDRSPKTFDGCRIGLQQMAAAGLEREVDSLLTDCERLQDAPASTAAVRELIARWYRVGGYPDAARRAFDSALVMRTEAAKKDRRQRRVIGFLQCELEDWARARETLLAAADTSEIEDRVALAIAAAHVGDTATVRATFDWLDRWPPRGRANGRNTMSRAFILVALGRRAESIALLRQAIAEGMAPPFQRWRNRFELVPLRGDPAFEALVRERP